MLPVRLKFKWQVVFAIGIAADLKETIVVIRDVPATICSLCGNEWISDDVAGEMECIVSLSLQGFCIRNGIHKKGIIPEGLTLFLNQNYARKRKYCQLLISP